MPDGIAVPFLGCIHRGTACCCPERPIADNRAPRKPLFHQFLHQRDGAHPPVRMTVPIVVDA